MRISMLSVSLFTALLALPATAGAQVFKYVNGQGSVVYTDNLAELPLAQRQQVQKRIEEQERKRAELEASIGREELQRREAEQRRAELAAKKAVDDDRQRKMAELDALIRSIDERRAQRDANKGYWVQLMRDARARLQRALAQFKSSQERYNQLAITPAHTLFPGQAEERDRLAQEVVRFEKEVDAANLELSENLPERARKESIPPGWLREP